MDAILRLESQRLAEELYALIQQIDPATFKAELAHAARERMARVKARAHELALAIEAHAPDLRASRFAETVRGLAESAEELGQRASRRKEDWKAEFKRLQQHYTVLARRLRADRIELPLLRQTNYRRNVLHALNGLLALVVVEHLVSQTALPWVIGAIAGTCWTLEAIRRRSERFNDHLFGFFEPFAHPHERHQVNSATWYASALVVMAVVLPSMAQSIGVVVLGLADPAAALVGRRFGRVRLRKNRTLEGSLAFLAVGTASALAVEAIYYPEVALVPALAVAFTAALAGAVAELVTKRIDDNLTIPLATGFATWAAMWAFV